MEEFGVVLVESTSQALRIESLLDMENIKSKLIPVPRFLSSNCGNCLRIDPADIKKVESVIQKNRVIIQGIEIIQY